jgi:hypothetical protein
MVFHKTKENVSSKSIRQLDKPEVRRITIWIAGFDYGLSDGVPIVHTDADVWVDAALGTGIEKRGKPEVSPGRTPRVSKRPMVGPDKAIQAV